VPRREREIGIARRLCSSSVVEHNKAIGAFVRLFTFSAPTELASLAASCPDVCASYCNDRPLAQHLLESLPIPRELSLAWRIALLDGKELSTALQTFHERYANRLRKRLARYCRDPDDVYQHLLLQLLTKRRFRQTFFGKYAGKGSLTSYLITTFVREAARQCSLQGRWPSTTELFKEVAERREGSPERAAIRNELRADLTQAFRQVAHDPGFLPFLLQQGFEMSSTHIASILGLSENAVRQRNFRFRSRFRRVWNGLHSQDAYPFASHGSSD